MENDQKKATDKERIGYGVKVPPISFNEAIQSIKKVSRLAGESASLDALASILGHSRSSSNFSFKIAALRNFGILTFDKLNYQLTGIGKRIVSPESASDEMKAIQEAFSKHELLDRVWGNYKGKVLPQKEYLANYIEKALEIPSSLKIKWAEYFFDAALFANLLTERESGSYQVLYEPSASLAAKVEETIESKDVATASKVADSRAQQPPVSFETGHWGILNQRKLSGDRKAIFAIPDELTQEDIDVLRVILKGIDAGLDGLKRFEEK